MLFAQLHVGEGITLSAETTMPAACILCSSPVDRTQQTLRVRNGLDFALMRMYMCSVDTTKVGLFLIGYIAASVGAESDR